MDIYKRIELAKMTKCRANCGTAFYIAGVIHQDGEVDVVPCLDYDNMENPPPLLYFSELPKLENPEHGCLVLFRHGVLNNFPRHMGVVLEGGNGFEMVHRKGTWTDRGNAEVVIDDLNEHLDWVKTSKGIIEYYESKPLQ